MLLGATALANLANGVGLLDEAHALFWREIAMVAELAQPAALLYVGLAFLNPAERRVNSSMLWPARITGFVGLLLAALAVTGQVFQLKTFEDGQAAIGLAAWGRIPYVFIVIGMTLGLAKLELVLRASHEPIRHKLKFVVIGLGGLAGYQIYQASQMLLFPVWQAEHVLVASVVTTVALGLIAFGLAQKQTARGLCKYLCLSTGPSRFDHVHHYRRCTCWRSAPSENGFAGRISRWGWGSASSWCLELWSGSRLWRSQKQCVPRSDALSHEIFIDQNTITAQSGLRSPRHFSRRQVKMRSWIACSTS